MKTLDGNEAAALVAYRASEVIAIYPITPSSTMGELADVWAVEKRKNLWGNIPDVAEMQSEGGAAGAVHGALQAGALTTTFTASQGLLLMIPNMYKIAGELTAFCMHVTARALATHALSIFGDHSDVMAVRQTGFAMLCSNSVQEAHDLACIAQASTLAARVPFLHFFDGFRTSHEVAKIALLSDDDLRFMIDDARVADHRARALTPDRPVLRGTAQNPDTFFQAREACNRFYLECPSIVQAAMDRFAERTGRHYGLFQYVGHPAAERIIIAMGSSTETIEETVERLVAEGEKVGLIKVHLYRPFSLEHFAAALPSTVKSIAVLDRTKEPGAIGDPLYLDVVTALYEIGVASKPRVIGGRYGLSSKEFTPAMVKAVFDELGRDKPLNHFTVGIIDDVTHTSLAVDDSFEVEDPDDFAAVFYGLGADGTVGANKNSIKIIGEGTDNFAQGYFVYDSKKSGATTVSHLRFGPKPIRKPYLVKHANFVACHQWQFVDRFDLCERARPGAVFLLNTPHSADAIWAHLPREIQASIVEKGLQLYVIDAYAVARDSGLGVRINTIMQTCFFAISGVLPREDAIARIKSAIEKTYGKRGPAVVKQNFAAVDNTLEHLHAVPVPKEVSATRSQPPIVPPEAPDFVQRLTALMLADKGDILPVSAFPVDGTWPLGTTRWEKRNLASEIPIWDLDTCIQCNQCALVCPHSAIRAKAYDPKLLDGAPDSFRSTEYRAPEHHGMSFTIQVAPEDCTGCNLCVEVCPAKNKSNPRRKAINMEPQLEWRDSERVNYDFFLGLPEIDRTTISRFDAKQVQLFEPLFEYSGACAGCGETPYVKLLTQLFGDRLMVANATGCSSIFGGNLPTTPYTTNRDGRGPAWSNSLFEDNAEFGYGMRLGVDALRHHALTLLKSLAGPVGESLVDELAAVTNRDELTIQKQRERVVQLRQRLAAIDSAEARTLTAMADYLVPKSVWMVGGDGWAYDIGYGGLDHVLGQNRDVNVLVLDTEVYSNTGGQASKSTPIGAAAKFATAGKETNKKDLGLEMMSYGHVYVARVAFGAKPNQVVQALAEADAYPGPSIVIAYSHCIAHGYDMRFGASQQQLAVDSGVWPLYRFDPRRINDGEPPLALDSGKPVRKVRDYMRNEVRFRMVAKIAPARYAGMVNAAQEAADRRVSVYQQLASLIMPQPVSAADGKKEG